MSIFSFNESTAIPKHTDSEVTVTVYGICYEVLPADLSIDEEGKWKNIPSTYENCNTIWLNSIKGFEGNNSSFSFMLKGDAIDCFKKHPDYQEISLDTLISNFFIICNNQLLKSKSGKPYIELSTNNQFNDLVFINKNSL